ncbi:MAG: nucleotide exchange factor GrpE [Chitinophagales bacterium]|nr:nucleotide exchange factor GrpE [Chitinophagales bacterium]
MENNQENTGQSPEENNQDKFENLSGEEILNKIKMDGDENTAATDADEGNEGNELLKRLGLSKKDKLKKENTELKQRAEELNDKYLRLYAEFDNYKKRTAKERTEFAKIAGLDVINSILPVLDDFKRAQKQRETSRDLNALNEGVQLIYQKLNNIFESRGLKPMNSIGEPFNPEFHDAITEVPVEDRDMKGRVVDEIESGYFLNDKIIRHAKVIVGK